MAIKNKVVIIMGATSGMGRATALKLNKEGAKVFISGRRKERIEEIAKEVAYPENLKYLTADVSQPQEVRAVIDQAIADFGRVDVLFNNAGVMPLGQLSDPNYDISVWKRIFDTNLIGVLNGIKAVLPQMQKQQSGLVISTSSVVGHVVMPAGAAYSASKFGVRAIMETLRQEENQNGIRSAIISPGATNRELIHSIGNEAIEKNLSESFGNDADYSLRAEDIANAVAYMVDQPEHVDVNEMIIRPRKQEL
ncbi:SDR family oxidoreductase [Fructobacillus fructosus]|uniref:NADP-dependent 3-hydroxy acid dehydrogenase YdfG (YdfG) n=1 Tax=Fructobacillus fructosus TaxID=1631 RepID=A0ABN9YMP9_9LACO|nr:SDR family oxidoreductase [Fructobacillus fructosus]MBC9118353.1 SDR family oxidoreductase [Fructobacillus fructosus]MBD9364574.1 SDR family oxidoreductase [Leuconostoc mesenteroides]CAK1229132.1 NADP-dependent 3-hydroxy acid dehydrogenase YdfG (YdfG) [Fructobacillus fructosus]CAK1251143.1 NADP-dependent 3-hydroxy acid dehydrogenase YdfG (YdfG) [Fructobacillus fructosus]